MSVRPKNGTWEGVPGDSNFIPDDPAALGLKPGEAIPFRKGRANFSKWSKGNFVSKEPLTGDHDLDMSKMIRQIARERDWTQKEVKEWLDEERLTPHHSRGDNFELIPQKLHGNPSAKPPVNGVRHMGGAYDLRNAP